jgi:hypothetical protein
MTKRERCIGIGCAIGKQMSLMFASAIILVAVAEGFNWAMILLSKSDD